MGNQSAEYEAERLDRLEREVRRRQWDSVLVGRPRDAAAAPTTPAQGLPTRREPAAEAPVPASPDAYVALDLMAERLERIERLALRLESEVRRLERHGRRDRWRLLATLVVASFAGLTLIPVLATLQQLSAAILGR